MSFFGYNKITIERPLRLSAQFTTKNIAPLRFDKGLQEEMAWAYEKFGDEVYSNLDELKPQIEIYLKRNEIKLKASAKKKLFNQQYWETQLKWLLAAEKLMGIIGTKQHDDFNVFTELVKSTIKSEKLKLDAKTQNRILEVVSWKNEDAERVIKKTEKSGTIIYLADPDLRDYEKVPLDISIDDYFKNEVEPFIPDAWVDHSKTARGYEIAFYRTSTNLTLPRLTYRIQV